MKRSCALADLAPKNAECSPEWKKATRELYTGWKKLNLDLRYICKSGAVWHPKDAGGKPVNRPRTLESFLPTREAIGLVRW